MINDFVGPHYPFGLLVARSHKRKKDEEAKALRRRAATEQAIRERELCRAGNESAKILESPESAYRCLSHGDAGMRQAALFFLCSHWNQAEEIREDILRLSLKDPSPHVREAAISQV